VLTKESPDGSDSRPMTEGVVIGEYDWKPWLTDGNEGMFMGWEPEEECCRGVLLIMDPM
jgi:hypothetical protein